MNLLIIGAPGTGKGTMSDLLVKQFGIVHISTGDMLRESIAEGTVIGIKAQSYVASGKLVPDEVIHEIILERLSRGDIQNGFLMDGYPRTLAQAEDLDNILQQIHRKIDKVLNLNLAEDVLVSRISGRRTCSYCKAIYHIVNKPPRVEGVCDICGHNLVTRNDDTVESLKTRLEAYHKLTKPVIAYYERKNLVVNIDANQSVANVFADICQNLECVHD